MRRSSRSPLDETLVAGKIMIENLPRRTISTSDVHNWLKKYGSISEISVYKDCVLVQFESDLEAAGAVQCEDGSQFFGSVVSIKHVEPGVLSAIRRSGPALDKFTSGTRHYPLAVGRDRDRDRDRDRPRDRDRDRGRPRDRDSPRNRFSDSGSYDRRRRRDDLSPRKRSRSPIGQRGDRRHVHPLNWLSEVAGTDKNAPINGSIVETSNTGVAPVLSTRNPPPYTIAIVAVQHDLVAYAEMIEKRVSACIRIPDHVDRSELRTHIVVLLSADHLTPCLGDLTKDGVPFAIICTTTNWTHGSCTLRILYVPTQQEHRNMPLDDAMILLQKEYDARLALENPAPTAPAVRTPAPVPPPITSNEDNTFLAPSRDMTTLLRMLADSRILSIGELDEIAAFVQERKRRLEGRRIENASSDSRTGGTMDLKSRILNMIYPQNSGGAVPGSSYTGLGAYQAPPDAISVPSAIDQTSSRLNAGLANPVVQQAIDTLMRYPSDRFAQPPMQSLSTQPGVNIDVMSRSAGGPRSGPVGAPLRPTPYGTDMGRYGQPTKPMFASNRMDKTGTDGDHIKIGQLPDSKTGANLSNQRYSTYKQLTGDGPAGQQKKDLSTGFKTGSAGSSRGPVTGSFNPNVVKSDAITSQVGTGLRDDEAVMKNWSGRKRGSSGHGSQSADLQRQSYVSSDQKSQRPLIDLMAAEVAPVGALAESFKQAHDAYHYSRGTPLLPTPGGSLFGSPSVPFYMSHPSSFPYAGKSYY